MEMSKSNNVLGGTSSVPTEEIVKNYLEVRKDIKQKIKEKCIMEMNKSNNVLGGTLSVPTEEEEEAVLMDTMEEFIAERLSMSEEERNVFDSIPAATRDMYGKMPKEIVANYLKEHE